MSEQYSFDPRLPFGSTIPASWYTKSDIYQRETICIFKRTWQLAGRLKQVALPGQYFTLDIAGEPLIVVAGADHRLRALSNVCRHRAGPVTSGEGTRSAFRCGYHGWTYGLDGHLLGCPEFDGVENFDKAANSLPEFRIETRDGFIFVNLDTSAPPLNNILEGLVPLPRCEPVARKDWVIECNWKVYVDNYLEGYHIPIVHPSLNNELDYVNYRTEIYPFLSLQRSAIRGPESPDEVRYFWIFPNLMINVYADNFSTNLVVPLGPERTRTIFEWYFFDSNVCPHSEAVKRVVDVSEKIQLEDIAICESVQRGLRSSTYSSGRYSVRRESGVHHFHGLLSRSIEV